MKDSGPNAYKTALRPNITQAYRITARVKQNQIQHSAYPTTPTYFHTIWLSLPAP